ncbi:MAG: hypothetical protein ACHQII_00230 [Bacteroidia bacterium]
MEKETVIKYHIRILTVNMSGEKQLFQIKLPRNAKKITGILVTVKAFGRIKGRPTSPAFPPLTPILKSPVNEIIKLTVEPLIPIEHAI